MSGRYDKSYSTSSENIEETDEIEALIIELQKAKNTIYHIMLQLKKKGVDKKKYMYDNYISIIDENNEKKARIALNERLQNITLNK